MARRTTGVVHSISRGKTSSPSRGAYARQQSDLEETSAPQGLLHCDKAFTPTRVSLLPCVGPHPEREKAGEDDHSTGEGGGGRGVKSSTAQHFVISKNTIEPLRMGNRELQTC